MKTEYIIHDEGELENIIFPLFSGDRISFIGDLGSGKTTFIRALIRHYLSDPDMIVRSPTYTYYNKYRATDSNSSPLYHFDLYRIEDISTFANIGGTEILENTDNILLIEWPDRIDDILEPTKIVTIVIVSDTERRITIEDRANEAAGVAS